MNRSCSDQRKSAGALAAGLVFAAMAVTPKPMWGQWNGTSPVWTNSNVGIGTSTPASLLEVSGDSSGTLSLLRLTNSYSSNGAAQLLFSSKINSGSIAQMGAISSWVANGGDYGYGGLLFRVVNNGNLTEALRLYRSGQVGIGASSSEPSTMLLVKDNYPGGGRSLLDLQRNNGQSAFFASSAGNIGVGTNSPSFKLDVQGGYVNSSGGFCINGTNCITAWPAGGGGSGTVTSIATGTGLTGGPITSSGTISLNLSSANAWTANQSFGAGAFFPGGVWHSNGNVGIATMTPSATLTVSKGSNGLLSGTTNTQGLNLYMTPGSVGVIDSIVFGSYSSALLMRTYNNGVYSTVFFGDETGNVGIGTTSPQYKLAVNGSIGAQDIIVTNTGWSDYVFRPGYRLRPLSEVSQFIQKNGHLPDIPTEAEVKEKGVSVGEMQAKLLAKVEELTLHMIQQEKENRELREELTKENQDLRERLARLERGATTDSTSAVAK